MSVTYGWYCAHFDQAPNAGVLNELRRICGPSMTVFIARGAARLFSLYLPPPAEKCARAINNDPKLPSFNACAKPADDGRMEILFGDEEDLSEYFPKSAVARSSE